MKVYVRGIDAEGREMLGTDGGAVVPRSVRTERGAIRWARAWIARRELVRARVEFCLDERPYGTPLRVVEVRA